MASRIRDRDATVAVVGLGYVGLPLLVQVGRAGFTALGYDVDEVKVRDIASGRSPIIDVTDAEIRTLNATYHDDVAILARADVVVICVPTPLLDGAPDLGMVRTASESVAAHMTPGTLVILESTTYPGTTEELVRPIIESAGARAGVDVAIAYSPERIDPGRGGAQVSSTPKIVAGVTDRCRELAVSFYASFVNAVATTSTPREAEMAKLIENTYRQVNIALVNELAMLARDLDVDIWESLHAASTKPFGYQVFWPGPGVGGHCIAIDPTYLSWRASQQRGYRPGFIEHANEVNNRMPGYVATRIADLLNNAGLAVKGSRVFAIGVAFKPGVGDMRGSPAIEVLERLVAAGAVVSYHDPFVDHVTIGATELSSVPLIGADLSRADVVVILTPHVGIDLHAAVAASTRVFDARGATVGIDAPHVERL